MMNTEITFGGWLKQRRQNLGLTQQQLADCASCSLIAVRKLEADERRPSVQLAEQFARCLQIAPDGWATFIKFARREGEAPAASPSDLQAESAVIAAPMPAPPTNLPAPLTSLLGRDQEIGAVCALLLQPELRLCTLTGPGGIGKTRLALEVARRLWQTQPTRFGDGVYFVDLAAVEDPQLVLGVIATTLSVKETPGSARADSLKSFLQARHMLLVLDNLEQIVEAGSDLVQLLEAAPTLRLIVTSRTVLQVYGEQEFPVPPLPLPRLEQLPPSTQLQDYAAIALFVERARAVRSDLIITAEMGAAIAELCVRLDGLPLAIELAAARSKLFTPQRLLNQLARRLDFLTTPNRGVAERQRTLRQTIDWSFNLLDEVEKRLFARLGVFAGEFTLEAAQAVVSHQLSVITDQSSLRAENRLLNTDDWLLDTLIALVNHSVVQSIEPTELDETMPRFRLLLTLREYALEQLVAQGEQEEIQARHAEYYLALTEKAAAEMEGARQTYWYERLTAEHDNLRGALAWGLQTAGQPALSLRLATALARFWFVRGHLAEGRRWLAQTLEKSIEVAPRVRAAGLTAAGMLARYDNDHMEATPRLQTALALWQSLAEPADPVWLARIYMNLGGVAWSQEAHAEARGYFAEALVIERRAGNLAGVGGALHNLGLVEQYQGHFAVAHAYMEECIAIDRQIGNDHALSLALNSLGTLHQELGEYATARVYLEESLVIARSMRDRDRMAMVLNNLGNVALSEGNLVEAKRYYDDSLTLAIEIEAKISIAFADFGLGMVALLQQDDAAAHRQMSQALAIWHEFKMKRVILRVLDCMALYFSRQGQPERSLRLLGFAEVLREGHLLPPRAPAFLPFYKQAVANARGRLTPAQFVAAWQQGRTLPLEEAVTLALAKNDGHDENRRKLLV